MMLDRWLVGSGSLGNDVSPRRQTVSPNCKDDQLHTAAENTLNDLAPGQSGPRRDSSNRLSRFLATFRAGAPLWFTQNAFQLRAPLGTFQLRAPDLGALELRASEPNVPPRRPFCCADPPTPGRGFPSGAVRLAVPHTRALPSRRSTPPVIARPSSFARRPPACKLEYKAILILKIIFS